MLKLFGKNVVSRSYLCICVDVFLVIGIKEVCHAVVRDLDLVVVFQQDVPGSQVFVNHAVFFQVKHTLLHKLMFSYCSYFTTRKISDALTLAICTHQLSSR